MRPQQATDGGNAANAFQQNLTQGWQQALASIQQMAHISPQAGKLSFDPIQLKSLQEQYLREATQLWNQGLSENPVSKDRRFSGEAWAITPWRRFQRPFTFSTPAA